MLTANEIRRQFIDFFVSKHGHTFVPSSSVVPLDDPTLMFANAGMNQFKDVFLGTGTRPYRRAANTQKCIRASGKHNDLEDVGRDTYHHTFFEMLGNWSFGDYYKAEAIRWAWELLTKEWGLDKSRLHATVFGGDQQFGLEADEEAASLWTKVTDIDPSHVHRFGKKDNFWMMGETGPCGPCTEIHIDRTPDKSGGKLVNAGDARVMEIWNLVFIQYNRDDQGVLTTLPAKHVDTGMGFERVTAVLQDKASNYDTDVFTPLLAAFSAQLSAEYTGKLDDPRDIAFRVLADHLRMATFAITDGALPGNKGRGSVIRSVLRRAVRFGWQVFGQREPFIFKLVPTLVEQMGQAFPELKKQPGKVADVIKGEEADFLSTIERGLSLFEEAAGRAGGVSPLISGKDVFTLYTTYGFPPDLTRQMAQERGLAVDEASFQEEMTKHVAISRGKAIAKQSALNVPLPETDDRPKWSGPACEGKILGWVSGNQFLKDGSLPEGQEAGLVLDRTSFYAEAGGQIGDSGTITTPTGVFEVTATVKLGAGIVHLGQVANGRIEMGQAAQLKVSPEREFTRKNHTATHLLHWALHKVLGEHVEQKGSSVKPDEFTFDFSHTGPMTAGEKAEVERLVNEKIYQDLPVQWRELPQAAAKQLPGVKHFFGDKYGDTVRVVEIGDGFSREFCGGTHLDHTGQAGFFKVVREEGIQKGVRRIFAVTGPAAVAQVQKLHDIVTTLAGAFNCKPEEVPGRVAAQQEEIKRLEQQIRKMAAGDLTAAADQLLAAATEVNGAKVVVGPLPAAPVDQVLVQMDRLRQKIGSGIVFVGWEEEGKAQLLAVVTDDLAARGVSAGKLIGPVAQVVGGKGGGKPTKAQAGGKDPAKLGEALELAKKLAMEAVGK